MPIDSAPPAAPKMFLSYAWSSAEHQKWVLNLAHRLMADGVDVIFDKWHLKPGQDGNVFMEQMVNDPTLSKVLMICDHLYVDKANGRRGGVGTEAQIISPQLYRNNSANQTKIVAACLSRDADNEPLVPSFYKGRIHFDFTDATEFETAYGEVIRWAHDLPQHVPPSLGTLNSRTLAPQRDRLTTVSARPSQDRAVALAEAFRSDRLKEIAAGRTPVPLSGGAMAALQIVSLPMLESGEIVDIVSRVMQGTEMPVPLSGRGENLSVNIDGICNNINEDGYGQLSRNGTYEGTFVFSIDKGKPYVASITFANMLVGSVRRGLRLQAHYNFPPPAAVLLSLCNAAELTMRLPTEFGAGYYETQRLNRPFIAFPCLTISGPDVDTPAVVRPLLNTVWNAFGQAVCNVYDGKGLWIGIE